MDAEKCHEAAADDAPTIYSKTTESEPSKFDVETVGENIQPPAQDNPQVTASTTNVHTTSPTVRKFSLTDKYRREDEEEEEEEDEEEDKIVEKSLTGRFHKRNKRFPRQVPGIDNAFIAIEPKSGKELIWNEINLSEKRAEQGNKFVNVVRKLKKLYHPFLVRFLDAWIVKNEAGPRKMVFVTERLDEGTLKQFICNSARTNRLWKRHMGQLLSVLKFLNQLSVNHGYLTNETIYYQNSGNLKVGAFSVDGFLESKVTAADDIYALGILALEIAVWDPSDDNPQLSQSERLQRMLDRLDNPAQRSFIQACLDPVPGSRPTLKELIGHPAMIEAPTLKLLSAKVIVGAMRGGAEDALADTTQAHSPFATLLKDYLSHLEDETVIIEVHYAHDDKKKSRSWKDFRSNFTLTSKFLDDVRNGFYPLFGCKPTWPSEEDYNPFFTDHGPTFAGHTSDMTTSTTGTFMNSEVVSRKESVATRYYMHQDMLIEEGGPRVVTGGVAPPDWLSGTDLGGTSVSESQQIDVSFAGMSDLSGTGLTIDGLGQPGTGATGHATSAVVTGGQMGTLGGPAGVGSSLHLIPSMIPAAASFLPATGGACPSGETSGMTFASAVNGPASFASTAGTIDTDQQQSTTEAGAMTHIPGSGDPLSPILAGSRSEEHISSREDTRPPTSLSAHEGFYPSGGQAGSVSESVDHPTAVTVAEEDEGLEEEEEEDEDNEEQEEHMGSQIVYVQAPDRAPTHPALFTNCQYCYVGCGRWQINLQMWFVEERLKRDAFIQVLEKEWHNFDRVVDLLEASHCVSPEDRPLLARLLHLAAHNYTLLDGELVPPPNKTSNFDAYELHEKLVALELHHQAEDLLTKAREAGSSGVGDKYTPQGGRTLMTMASSGGPCSLPESALSPSEPAATDQQQMHHVSQIQMSAGVAAGHVVQSQQQRFGKGIAVGGAETGASCSTPPIHSTAPSTDLNTGSCQSPGAPHLVIGSGVARRYLPPQHTQQQTATTIAAPNPPMQSFRSAVGVAVLGDVTQGATCDDTGVMPTTAAPPAAAVGGGSGSKPTEHTGPHSASAKSSAGTGRNGAVPETSGAGGVLGTTLPNCADVRMLAPRNFRCPVCDTHDYLHRTDVPVYVNSPCYHCREYLAKENKISPEALLDLHLQYRVPWPAFLQARYKIPADGRNLDEMIVYDCGWRSRRPCRCFADGRQWPPCVEFPWMYEESGSGPEEGPVVTADNLYTLQEMEDTSDDVRSGVDHQHHSPEDGLTTTGTDVPAVTRQQQQLHPPTSQISGEEETSPAPAGGTVLPVTTATAHDTQPYHPPAQFIPTPVGSRQNPVILPCIVRHQRMGPFKCSLGIELPRNLLHGVSPSPATAGAGGGASTSSIGQASCGSMGGSTTSTAASMNTPVIMAMGGVCCGAGSAQQSRRTHRT